MVKKNVLVRIDQDLLNRLWQYIKKTYPNSTYGALSLEIQKAIEHWLSEREASTQETPPTHTKIQSRRPEMEKHEPINSRNSGSRTMRTLMRIVERLCSHFPNEATQNDVEKIIAETAGGHRETVRKYFRLLKEYGFIIEDRRIFGSEKFIFQVNPKKRKELTSSKR